MKHYRFLLRNKIGFSILSFLLLLGIVLPVAAQVTLSHIKFEAETGGLSGLVTTASDSLASGGSYIRFNAPNPGPSGKRCVVFLHGKGGGGAPTTQEGGATWIWPTGNADGWGGRQWLYATSAEYNQALTVINNALVPEACGQIVLAGGSNGAAMAAKTYCQGQNFGGRLVGAIVDDPVPDQGVDNCAPATGVSLQLIQSDEMNSWVGDSIRSCASMGDWTCQGNVYPRLMYSSRIGAVNPYYSPRHEWVRQLYDGWMSAWWR